VRAALEMPQPTVAKPLTAFPLTLSRVSITTPSLQDCKFALLQARRHARSLLQIPGKQQQQLDVVDEISKNWSQATHVANAEATISAPYLVEINEIVEHILSDLTGWYDVERKHRLDRKYNSVIHRIER
jgi:hypothetical protein